MAIMELERYLEIQNLRIVFKLILYTKDQNVTKPAIRKHKSARKLKMWQKQ